MKNRFARAFTLIEILFVILMLGLIIVHIANIQAQKMQATLIENGATDLDNLVPPLVNYYINNNHWPSSLDLLANSSYSPPYIPNTLLCSPFLTSTANQECSHNSPYALTLPSQKNYLILSVDTGSRSYAQLLAQKLQNAWITGSNGTIVNTAIPAPGTDSNSSTNGYLVSAGIVSTTGTLGPITNNLVHQSTTMVNMGTSIKLPNCPAGYEGHLLVSPIYYQTAYGKYNNQAFYYTGFHLSMLTRGDNNSSPPSWYDTGTSSTNSIVYPVGQDTHGKTTYAVTLADVPVDENAIGSIRHEVSFLTICLPSGNWQTNYIYSGNWADGQCSQTWALYEQLLGNANYLGAYNQANPYPCALMDNQGFQQQAVGVATAY
jgi:competence protein ComGC